MSAEPIGARLYDLATADELPEPTNGTEPPIGDSPHPGEVVEAVNPYIAALIDIRSLIKNGPDESDWLIEPLIAAGRSTAIVAPKKVGKSLITLILIGRPCSGLESFTNAARKPLKVLYIDHEMTDDDVYERLIAMGFDRGEHLDALADNLKYSLLPMCRPLDTAEGGAFLIAAVDELKPDMVVIDTLSRVTEGDENDARTFQNYYQFTGQHLKRRKVGVLRLDHMGKDPRKGSRGSSAKGDDVDVVWHLSTTDDGWRFTLEASRMGWVPAVVNVRKDEGDPLMVRLVEDSWPPGCTECAAMLDAIGCRLLRARATAGTLPERHYARVGTYRRVITF
jgi:hypothetical protein